MSTPGTRLETSTAKPVRRSRLLWQANSWTELAASGTLPTRRNRHSAVWSEMARGMYIFGGLDGRILGVCRGRPVESHLGAYRWPELCRGSDNFNDVFFYQAESCKCPTQFRI